MNNKLVVFPLFFFLFLFIFSSPVIASSTFNYNYILDDVYVRNVTPTSTNPVGSLAVGSWSSGTDVRRSWMSWNTSTLGSGAGVVKANLSLYCGYGFGPDPTVVTINVYNLTTRNWTQSNLTWNTQPAGDHLFSSVEYTIAIGSWATINITDMLIASLSNNETSMQFLMRQSNESLVQGCGFQSKENSDPTYRPYMTVEYSSSDYEPCGNYTGYPEGTTCLGSIEDSTRRGYVSNYDFCHLKYGSCPVGSICVSYTNTNPALSTTPVWTVNTTACLNLTTAHIITNNCIDYYGNVTNCSNITTTNSSYETDCSNTTSICYDNNCFPVQCSSGVSIDTGCTSWAGGVALGLGGFLGVTNCGLAMNISSIIITLIASMSIVAMLGYYAKMRGKELGTIFVFATLMLLVLFTISGWFPSWLIIVLIVVSALSMGGVLGGMVGG